ncbi:oxygenase MpaB family protein [Nocardioides jiangxiensis]|uniref:Oxygenase MpaB family protein n=1 Tax=Nocardioides jiangxiensis TaxID=3064524 RepID=A0ABT9B040_9ACTN|nr:oxygenase MpaB family protein [Nocardioides sp. WY-20]MDO7868028.1 oxygenase MpaB family protein [Nocardioides sp. WY-20]
MAKRSRSVGLDPDVDFVEIARNLSLYEFPWDTLQSLSLALFRTYAVPAIGGLLDRTGAFMGATQKRYDDTGILLEVPLIEGFDTPRGRAAIRRINQMHHMYDIGNDDMRYVLATFVVVPRRWIADFGWRDLTDLEVRAVVRYYRELGRHLGIRDVPTTYDDFARLMDDYEAAHFAYDEGAARVAASTLALLRTFYPRPLRPLVDVVSRSLMEPELLAAFGLAEPGRVARRLARLALRLRARFVALLPPRRRPQHVADMRRIRSYPDGYVVEEMGTFAPGCPVPHGAALQRSRDAGAAQAVGEGA